jgi:hypothetical protein
MYGMSPDPNATGPSNHPGVHQTSVTVATVPANTESPVECPPPGASPKESTHLV